MRKLGGNIANLVTKILLFLQIINQLRKIRFLHVRNWMVRVMIMIEYASNWKTAIYDALTLRLTI